MRLSWSVVVLVLASVGCGDGVPKPATVDPVSKAEAEEMVRRFDAAMTPCDARELDAMIDMESLLRRAVAKAKAPPAAKQGFLRGARDGISVGQMLCQGIDASKDSSYELLRIRDVGGQPRPLFRLLGDGKVNYHELELGKSRTDHKIRVVDLHVYVSGELLSDTLAGVLEQSVGGVKKGDDMNGISSTMARIRAAQTAGDPEEVRRLIRTLPEFLRETKPIRLMELMAAADLDEATYADLIEKYERSFPGDPSLDMVSLDGFYMRKNVPAALAAIERIDAKVGGDPYLSLMRAAAYLLDPTPENLALADKWATETTVGMPTLENGWWTLAGARLQRGDHAGAIVVLDKLEADFGANLDRSAMESEPMYQSFVASPEFAAWWAKKGR